MATKMLAPAGRIPDVVKLNADGAVYHVREGVIFTLEERHAVELEKRFGWKRDAASVRAASAISDLMCKAADAAARRGLGGDPRVKTEIGEVETSVGRIRVVVDESEDVITLHGISSVMVGELDTGLRQAILDSASAFNVAQDQQQQVTARTVVGALVDVVLRQNKGLAQKVRERVSYKRYLAI